MSKLGCECGHVMVDQNVEIDYKASFLRSNDFVYKDKSNEDISSFIEAIINNQREEWLINYFGKDTNLQVKNEWILIYIQSRNEIEKESLMYQCDNCGRIKIQLKNSNDFASFMPEGENWKDILK